jgi:bacterioferritin-associated ferredoxin
MTSVGIPAWRRPVAAHTEEAYWLDGHGDRQRSLFHYIDGFVGDISTDAQDEIRRQLAAGERCQNCLTGYPSPVSPKNLVEIMREMTWGDLREQAMTYIAQGRCGVCGTEMSHDYFAANHVKSSDEVFGSRK